MGIRDLSGQCSPPKKRLLGSPDRHCFSITDLFGVMFPALLLSLGCCASPVQAQISADSSVNTIVTPQGNTFTITGGTAVGSNLFHSFSEFSVPTGGEAFFDNANRIANIFSRVSGGNLSQIDGILRTNHAANLFLLNPAGIVFGENSSLSLGGSLFATTAEQFIFADDLTFSASTPGGAPLLAINLPIGLQFGDQAQPIVNRSLFSQVAPQQSIILVGGEVSISGASLFAPQGDINIVSVGPQSVVDIIPGTEPWSLGTQRVKQFQDVSLTQESFLDTSGDQGGRITIHAHDLSIDDLSFLESVHFNDQIAQIAINLHAAGTVQILGGSEIYTGASGTGSGSSIYIQATDLELQGDLSEGYFSGIFTEVTSDAIANAGNIEIDVQTLHLGSGAEISSFGLGQGNAGNINITANVVELGTQNPPNLGTSILSLVLDPGVGQSGNITIVTQTLRALNGAQIGAVNFGQGDGGAVDIEAQTIELRGINEQTGAITGLFASVPANAVGNGGSIILTTDSLGLFDGAQIFSGTAGTGDGGSITIQATDIALEGINALNGNPSGILASVQAGGIGNGGSIDIQGERLQLLEGAQIFSGTFGAGESGSIRIEAGDLVLAGVNSINANPSGILASAGFNSVGNGGDITLNVDNLSLFGGSQVFSGAFAEGDGGTITIQAQNILLEGTNPLNTQQSSSILASVQASGVGNAGTINLTTDQLSLLNGAQIFNGTFGTGDGGSIVVQARDISLAGVNPNNERQTTSIQSTVQASGVGNAGIIDLKAESLSLLNGAQISNDTFGNGNGGPILIQAQDIQLSGVENDLSSGIFARVSATAMGNAGTLDLETVRLDLSGGAQISNSTLGQGNAGNIRITAQQNLQVLGTTDGSVTSEITATSSTNFAAGSVQVSAGNIQLGPQGRIAVNATNGQAGDITISSDQALLLDGGQVTAVTDQGDGGNLFLNLGQTLQLMDRSLISTTAGQAGSLGNGGNITINVPLIVSFPNENSDITANAFEGNGGTVQINAEGLFGIAFRDAPTTNSDITASSRFGVDGVVTIETPNVDPAQGLVALPTALADVSRRITKACETTAGQNSFAALGNGGLPVDPRHPLQTRLIWQDRRLWSVDQVQVPSPRKLDQSTTSIQLTEAQGWTHDSKGRTLLVAHLDAGHSRSTTACLR